MDFWIFGKKRGHEKKWSDLHSKLDGSFSNIKKDMQNISKWIKHFDNFKDEHSEKIQGMDVRLRAIEMLLENLKHQKNFLALEGVSKQTPVRLKQTSVAVQTPVQTGVQTSNLSYSLRSLTMMERALVWTLLNTDLKLNYNDLSLVMGKNKSTVRGQINNIKSKSEGLVLESVEKDGSKRFYISERIKERLLHQIKRENRGKSKEK